MATYAIGDIQGCFRTFQLLLSKINFDPSHDELWLAGDLVNRGRDSLAVLRWIYNNRQNTKVVLGNHDIYLLARHANLVKKPSKDDTLDETLIASDANELLSWLRHQPVLHKDKGFVMVHAGIHPKWSIQDAEYFAHQIGDALPKTESNYLLSKKLYLDQPTEREKTLWTNINIFTRLRMVNSVSKEPDYSYALHPDNAPAEISAWFKNRSHHNSENPEIEQENIIFGHWASLGLYVHDGVIGLDTGCVWGRMLSAFCLETRQITMVDSVE